MSSFKCGREYADRDVIVLNGTEEEVTTLESSMVSRRAFAKAAKVGWTLIYLVTSIIIPTSMQKHI